MATIGRGIIELVADATQLKAGISDAKSSLNTLRDAAKNAGETLNQQGIKYIRTLEKQDARLKTQAATFGQGKSEIAAYGAAQLGVAQTADSLVKSIAASEAAIKSKAKADRDAAAASQQLVVQQQAQQQVQRGFLQDLQKKVDVGSGKLPSELAAIKAAQLGVTAQSGPLIAALALQEKGLGNVATNARLARFQSQQLGFQLHDFFIQLQAGQNPLTAFLQQGSQLSGTFGGAGNAFKAVRELITPMVLGIGAAATAVGVLGLAMFKGAEQSKQYADALVLSGNFAGQTAATVEAAVKSISASGEVSRGAAREALAAITATGEIGPKAFAASAEATARYAAATGKSAKEVATEFATLGRDVTAGATKLNQSLNFLSAAQLQQIRNLQESGQQTEAYGIVIDALNTRLRSLEPNLGVLDKALRLTTNTWSKFWDAAFDVGRPDTIDDKIAKARAALERLQSPPLGARIDSALDIFGVNKRDSAAKENAQEDVRLLNRAKPAGEAAAIFAGERAELEKSTSEIRKRRDAQLDATKTDEARTKALRKLTNEFAELEKTGQGFTPKEKQILIEDEKRKFAPKKGRKDNEPEQVRKATLAGLLQASKDAFQDERDALAFHNRFLQGEYQAGNVSLQQFYQDKAKTTAQAVAAEIAELEKRKALLAADAKLVEKKDPSEAIKLRAEIADLTREQGKISRAAANEVKLANQQQEASFKHLTEQVTNYRANLLQLQGDEIGAAKLRAKVAIEQASILAKQAQQTQIKTPGDFARLDRGQTTGISVDVEGMRSALAIQSEFAEVQRKVSLASSAAARAEEAFMIAAERGGKSLIEIESGILTIREKGLKQLGALAAEAKKLADVSTDPRVKEFADELALAYERAADAVSPALNRLREANKALAAGLAGSLTNSVTNFGELYSKRRQDAAKDANDQRAEFDKKISQLQGYLADSQDKEDKAYYRKKIKEAQRKRDDVDSGSRTGSLFRTIREDVLGPLVQQISATTNKLLIQDPLQRYIEGKLKELTEGGGLLAGIFGDALKIKQDPKDLAIAAQTTALGSTTSALDRLTAALQNKTIAGVSRKDGGSSGEQSIADLFKITSNDPSSPGYENESDKQSTRAEANASFERELDIFTKQFQQCGRFIDLLGGSAKDAQGALGLMPSIISAITSAISSVGTAANASGGSSGGSSGGGGFWGSLISAGLSYFGGSGLSIDTSVAGNTGGITSSTVLPDVLRGGGMAPIGQSGDQSLFGLTPSGASNAGIEINAKNTALLDYYNRRPRFHDGGIVGGASAAPAATTIASAAALTANEVPAILMGGPKGTREEVLHARDPRHADNIAPSLLQSLKGGVGGDAIAKAIGGLGGEGGRAVGGIGGPGGDATVTQTNAGPIGAVTPRAPKAEPKRSFRALHDGGIVGKSGKQRSIPVNVFAQAIKYHDGGIVGQRTDLRGIPINVFVDAPKYHEGGVAGAPGAPGGSAAAIGGVGGGVGASAGQTIVGLTTAGGLGGDGIGGKGGDAVGGLGGKGGDARGIFVSAAQQIIVPALTMLQGAAGIGRGNARSVGGIGGKGGPGGLGGPGGASIGGQGIGGQAFAIGGAGGLGGPGGRSVGGNAFAAGGPGGNAIGGDAFATAGQMARQILTTFAGVPGGTGGIGGLGGQGIGGNAIGGSGGDAFAGSAQMARQILTTIAGAPGGKGGDAISAARESSSLMRTLLGPTNLISELRKETVNTERFENSTIREIRETGARALGGPVTAGGMYRVNERAPEVLSMGGKQWMMPMQDGKVTPQSGGDQRTYNVTVNQNFPSNVSRETIAQGGTKAGRAVQRELSRGTA